VAIQLGEAKPADSGNVAEGIIVHLSARRKPLEIEILEAFKVVQRNGIEVSTEPLFSAA
jgi:hypothetical protein